MTTIRAALALLALAFALPVLMAVQAVALRLNLPLSRRLPVTFHRFLLALGGVRVHASGGPARERPLLIVANHVSWLDIVTLTALAPVRFVAKAEIRAWPLVGWLARLQRSVFLDRGDRGSVAGKAGEVVDALRAGDLVVVFPEGTTSDGNRVMFFKSGLLGAVREAMGEAPLDVQPLAIVHTHAHGLPLGRARRHLAAYPGRVRLIGSLRAVVSLAALDIHVDWGEAVPYPPGGPRKPFAAALEARVRAMHAARVADARLAGPQRAGAATTGAPIGAAEAPRGAPHGALVVPDEAPARDLDRPTAHVEGSRCPAVHSSAVHRPASRGRAMTTPTIERRVFVKTYGCQMNVYDGDRMAEALGPAGYARTDTPDDADLVILNTCHIREKAAEKVYSELGRLRALKQERAAAGRAMTIGVAGCVAQAEGAEIIARAPAVDLVVGPQTYHRLPEIVARAARGERTVDTDHAPESKFDHLPARARRQVRARGVSAFLTVQEGCDKFCTFCVVPYTRGAETSRPAAAVLDEARALLEAGVREITLLGQNVNAWHGEGPDGAAWTLARLLRALAELGVPRLRYVTSHPRDMDDALIAAHGELPAVMPYLHLPVQSGSDRILKAMNRRHTAAHYLRLVERVRRARPDIAMAGDMIVGFPGETDADFEDTMTLVRETRYAACYSFKYSPRVGTPGADLPDQVPEAVKAERLARLQALIAAQQREFQASLVGRTLDVLVEKPGRHAGQMVGRSPYLSPVVLEGAGDLAPGALVRARVDGTLPNSLRATLSTGG